ncbi:hypothetical protein CIP107546_00426 [Corynebacterium diphtheriae]|uniref:DUF2190 family protein n=1 Tax=Corynebacterium diphtheriae TaxID=1717 RepID=UPI000B4AA6C3|nr:DUF2190 family protein [Corynebacterium diphtheriae]OWN41384.1 hypothetical protein AY488_04895 [Corynebacterium belfantii]OWN26104.1 hypothetical protein AY486_00645 [Corynebacterium diphtheriae bv. mitis]OWX99861.1 hypothetical protein B1A53_02520 [Corynebacterium diphtheriae]CAB0587695.1 hypothetical protein CIP107546_00426 [Corynebacterium diphtheriae]CAB0683926.1 hypothetical protein FRC0028_00616 [Corynebacterium diphtheriae]
MKKNQMCDLFKPGTDLTVKATEPITGKTFVAYASAMSGGNIAVKTATAGKPIAGVAKYDAPAKTLLGVARGSARVITVTAAEKITAGDAIEVGAKGKAAKHTTGEVVGWAVDNVEADHDASISLAY